MNSKRKLTTIIEQSVWKQSEGGPSKSLQMYTSSKEIEIFTSTENKLKKPIPLWLKKSERDIK